ncbi:unnamed protein product [Microthlaspi erraticum]|uniref:Rhodopsin n=1 Tax=Microthlaspi erraticum TaxID=1685480 RepID=A0A6D2KUA8_9BRAS|nr:unnamed protein product [Microthlaspi erraticum]
MNQDHQHPVGAPPPQGYPPKEGYPPQGYPPPPQGYGQGYPAQGYPPQYPPGPPYYGINKKLPRTIIPLSDSDTFPSSFHKTSQGGRKLTREELEKFSRESTEKALMELVSSPGYGEWAAKNAKRISVDPREESSGEFTDTVKRRRWF